MRSSSFTVSLGDARSSRAISALIATTRWLMHKMTQRRIRNALLELSDEQLKDIGLSRGQTESDVHVYSRY